MLEDLKQEMSNFFKDIDENIKDEKEQLYLKKRTAELVDFMMNEIEKIINYKEEKLNTIIKKQEQTDHIIEILNDKMDNIYEDIYDETVESDFLVTCP